MADTCEIDSLDLTTTLRLAVEAKKGDRRAVDRLFAHFLPRVRQIVALRMRRPVSSLGTQDDIVQEACLRAFQGIEGFEVRGEGALYNYLAKCVEGAILDAVDAARAQKRDERRERPLDAGRGSTLGELVLAGRGPRPSSVVRAKELEERIERALLELPDHQREIIVLAKVCGLSHREVMEAMSFRSEATSRKALSFALQKLEEKLRTGRRMKHA
jgi:RNA polymerase sigma factor (sigma-70 family)